MTRLSRGQFSISTLALVLSISAALSSGAAGKRFDQVAWLEIPAPMSAAESVGEFTEQIKPGSSALVAASVVALSFRFPRLNITDGIGAAVYFDTEHSADAPFQVAFIAKLSDNGTKPFQVKFKKHTLTTKLIDGKAIASESKALLKALDAPPQNINANSIISAKLQPAKLDKLYPGGLLAAIKNSGALAKTGKSDDSRLESIVAILKQCAKITLDCDVNKEQLVIHISAAPVPKSPLATATANLKGDIPREKLEQLARTLSGDNTFSIKNRLKDTLAATFKGVPSQQLDKIAAELLDIRASSDGKNILVTLTTTPQAVKQLVDTVDPPKQRH